MGPVGAVAAALHTGPWRDHLSREMELRAPVFRPAWAVLLAPEVAYTGPPQPFVDLGTD